MAKGSEQFAFSRHPGIPRVCAGCGKKLKVADVADVREHPVPGYRCLPCAFGEEVAAYMRRQGQKAA